jgi:RND family efflux transporter MFP subunit
MGGVYSWQRCLVAAVLVGAAAAAGCTKAAPPAAPKPPEVDVAVPVQEKVTDYAVFTGSLQAKNSVNLVAQVTGYLLPEPMPKEGSDVKKGQPLFKIDPRVYQAALDQAKAKSNTDQDVYRRDVASPNAISAETITQDKNAFLQDQAAEESARINLNFTDIAAPFDGRISRRNVDPGNLVSGPMAGNITVLASIVQLDPIYAFFDVDERTLLRIHKLVDDGVIPPESIKGKNLPVNLALSNEGMSFTYTEAEVLKDAQKRKSLSSADLLETPAAELNKPRHPGAIAIVDNQENVQTGTLRMWGEFPNPIALGGKDQNPAPRLLAPGMFARIQLPIGPPRPAVLINEACLVSDQGRQLLYIVGPPDDNGDGTVSAHYVTTGPEQNGLRVIEEDLSSPDHKLSLDDKVVLNGLQRVRDKGKVRIREVIAMPRGDEAAGAAGKKTGPRDQGGAKKE